jgi:uncharacterized protein
MSASVSQNEVVSQIRAHRMTLESMGVKSLGLFGSVARNEANDESDVDILVEFSKPVGFSRSLTFNIF